MSTVIRLGAKLGRRSKDTLPERGEIGKVPDRKKGLRGPVRGKRQAHPFGVGERTFFTSLPGGSVGNQRTKQTLGANNA